VGSLSGSKPPASTQQSRETKSTQDTPSRRRADLIHLKQPAEPFGPQKLLHDHARGRSELYEPADLLEMLERSPGGMLVADAARALFETSATPTPNQIEQARRKLNSLVKKGDARRKDDPDGAARYLPLSP
jgi:hypothetical protein